MKGFILGRQLAGCSVTLLQHATLLALASSVSPKARPCSLNSSSITPNLCMENVQVGVKPLEVLPDTL